MATSAWDRSTLKIYAFIIDKIHPFDTSTNFMAMYVFFFVQVIIAANTNPALNDMTYREMRAVMETIKEKCIIIRAALESSRLHLVSNGQSSPCLDLSRVNQNLNQYVLRQQVDLVIIEGMGRAIHTNLDAKFTCESIRLAVIKNKWLAERLGGNTFSVVFKYEA